MGHTRQGPQVFAEQQIQVKKKDDLKAWSFAIGKTLVCWDIWLMFEAYKNVTAPTEGFNDIKRSHSLFLYKGSA